MISESRLSPALQVALHSRNLEIRKIKVKKLILVLRIFFCVFIKFFLGIQENPIQNKGVQKNPIQNKGIQENPTQINF